MKRKFYNVLMDWKNKNIDTPLMVVGARQIGKTYIINELFFINIKWINGSKQSNKE